MRIAVAGAAGLVGRHLCPALQRDGHEVLRLVRRAASGERGEIPWNPATGAVDVSALENFDAVIHLGGAGIADRRWTAKRKLEILRSRIDSTRALTDAFEKLRAPPRTFVCASAIGYYADRGDEWLDESSPPGAGFLSDVCQQWETAASAAEKSGARTLRLRTGLVLSAHGGALARMLPVFRWGMGGRLGSGRQWMSWIGLTELVDVVSWLLNNDQIRGPVNLVGPNPVTNAEFTRTLAAVLHRPAFAAVPAGMIQLLLGEMGEQLLLAGQRVRPGVLERAGYAFRFPTLAAALHHELQR